MQAGLLVAYFRWTDGGHPDHGERFRRLSSLAERVQDAVARYEGVVCHIAGNMIAAVFSGDWTGRETAVRTVRAAQEVSSLFRPLKQEAPDRSAEDPSVEGLVVADYLSMMEGVLSSGPVLRYMIEAERISAYYGVTPAIGGAPLTLSSQLVAAARGVAPVEAPLHGGG